jgi:Lrp/AsnC family transcriptional regulator, regulator for asnA, asnC and gidA
MAEIRLDLLDKKIINALNQNVRATYSEIAKKVRSSKEVVNYRIKRLMDQGIIKEFVTIFGFSYWSHKVLIQFEKINNKEEKDIINFLHNHPRTNWVTPCSGNWDLVFAIIAKDPKDFDKQLRGILEKIGKYLQDYKLATSIGSTTFGHTYVLGIVKEPRKTKSVLAQNFNFDDKNKKIAKVLRSNARAKLMEIATKTKIPIDTVKYRIKRMEEEGFIKRYRLVLDPSKLGYNRYEIFIRCVNLTDAVIGKFHEYAKQNHNIEYFSRCVGSWDIEFTVHFRTNEELREFVLEVKELFGEYIKNFESVTLFETSKFISTPDELK